ncbi:unnamed protein product [Prunus armeniaca]
MTTQSSEPPAQPASTATAPALMDYLAVGLVGSQAPASSASSVAQPKNTRVTNNRINIGYDEQHRAAPTAELHSSLARDIGHVVRTHCPMQWKSWKVMSDEIKTEVRGQLSTNYNLERTSTTSRWRTSTDSSLRGTNSGRATCTPILRRLMIRKSLFRRVARRSLRGGRIVGRGSALIFRRSLLSIKPKSIRAIGGRRLFSTIQVPGPSPIGWMHDGRGGPNSQRSTSLATMVEKSQLVLQESASQLPPDTPIEFVDPPQDVGF